MTMLIPSVALAIIISSSHAFLEGAALVKLSADHERKGSHIAESVRMMITKNQRLRGKYQYPGAENDRLYESTYKHRGGDQGCEMGCDSTSPPVLQRSRRDLEPDEPVVHYGLIASADSLMKDAIARDRLIEKYDILCFEMEAAGLMNNFPCVVIRGICDYSDSHKNDAWQGYAAVAAASYTKELLYAMPVNQVVHTRTIVERSVKEAQPPPTKPIFTVPFPKDESFVDRKIIFSQIEEYLQLYHHVSLSGIGGIGKSQIAIEYAYRFRQSQPQSHIFWIYAANSTQFVQSYQDVARKLRLPGYDDSGVDPCKLVYKWLDEDDSCGWLMILDNADNADLFFRSTNLNASPAGTDLARSHLVDYVPKRLDVNRSLIITTRSRHVGEDLVDGESCIEIPPFSLQEAESLLQRKTNDILNNSEPSVSRKLLDILGYIPLATTQAAAFIKRNQMNTHSYLAALEGGKQNLADFLSHDLRDHRRPSNVPNAVFRTWSLSFDQILTQEPQTAKLLSLLAMLDPQGIPEKLLRRPAEREVNFRIAIGTLKGYALITREIGGKTYTIHPLVQASVHYWLEQRSQREKYAGEALQILSEEFPNGEHEYREICESLLAHAQAVLGYQYEYTLKKDIRNRADLLHKVGWFDWQQGRYIPAYQAAFKAYNIYQNQLGEVSIPTLDSLSLLAAVLHSQGKYEVAEEKNRRALKGYQEILGVEHLNTLISLSNLAEVLRSQGKHEEAEEMNRRGLKAKEKVLGVEHPSTLSRLSNLFLVLQSQGKYEEAEVMGRHALKAKEKVLGAEHPATLASLNNLAFVLRDQKKYEEAEGMIRRALKGKEKVLGVEHPQTLSSLNNLASVLQIQGKYEEAEEMTRRALKAEEKVLGLEHPETLISLGNLADTLQSQGKYEEAEEMHRRAVKGKEKVLGVKHPGTLNSLSILANTLRRQGKYEEAEFLSRQALKGQEKVLGAEHPETLASLNNLALVLLDQKKYEEAEEMSRRALDGSEKVLGVEHPDTLTSVQNFAFLFHAQKKYKDSSALYLRASAGFSMTLGPDHPKTQRCSKLYAAMTKEMEDQAREG